MLGSSRGRGGLHERKRHRGQADAQRRTAQVGRDARDERPRGAHVARRGRPAAALHHHLLRGARLRARVGALPRCLRVGRPHGAALPPEGGGAGARHREPGLGERPGFRPALPRATPANLGEGRLARGAGLRRADRDDALRPRAAAARGRALRGPSGGSGRPPAQDAPLHHRRHGWLPALLTAPLADARAQPDQAPAEGAAPRVEDAARRARPAAAA